MWSPKILGQATVHQYSLKAAWREDFKLELCWKDGIKGLESLTNDNYASSFSCGINH